MGARTFSQAPGDPAGSTKLVSLLMCVTVPFRPVPSSIQSLLRIPQTQPHRHAAGLGKKEDGRRVSGEDGEAAHEGPQRPPEPLGGSRLFPVRAGGRPFGAAGLTSV